MQLLSINVGGMCDLGAQGETIRTGFFKSSRHGKLSIMKMGLSSDHRGAFPDDLDRAVYVYAAEHYSGWNVELDRSLTYGTFGENLTIAGADEDDIFVGDLLRIGTATLQVAQPRMPCRKLTARIDAGPDFPLRFLRSGRSGFFCRVIDEGEVELGDSVELVPGSERSFSVARITQLIHFDHEEADLQKIVDHPQVAADVKDAARRLLAVESSGDDWQGFKSLRIVGKQSVTSDVVSFDLESDVSKLPDFQAGQFVTIKRDHADRFARMYTIVDRSGSGAGYKIALKRAVVGEEFSFSNFAHDSLDVGDEILAMRPRGHFILKDDDRAIVLLSAGVGITPLLCMLRRLVEFSDPRHIHFIHCSRTPSETAFMNEVLELQARAQNVRVEFFHSQSDEGHRRLSPEDLSGMLNGLDANFYVCGPDSFTRGFVIGLNDRGVPRERLEYELFGRGDPVFAPARPDGDPVLDADGRPILVTFAQSGTTAAWTTGAFSLLSIADAYGVKVQSMCRTGVCGLCRCSIDSGQHATVIEINAPVREGELLLCASRPTTSLTLDI